VVIVDGSGNDVSFMLSNSSGDYFTAGALAPGPYYLYAAASGHLAEYYDNVPCNGFCSEDDAPVRGTAVVVAEGAAVTDRNFALAPASRITGTVTSASGAPIEDADVEAYTLSGAFVGSGFTDEDGEYVIDGLPAGTYRIATDVSDNYVNEVWDNVTCLGSCGSDELQAGIPIVVGAAETVSGRNFALEPGAAIAGAVTDAATGAPIADVLVFALDAREEAVVVSTDDTGAYRIDGLPAGTYRLLTDDAQFAGYLNEIFDNVPCQRVTCSYTQVRQSGAPIVLTAGSSATANFGLALGGRITGTITDTATGAPVAGVSVHAVRRVGVDLDESASFPTGSSGVFTIAGLPAGAWSVFTSNGSGYFNEIHPDIPCPGFCSGSHALAGSAIAVTVGATSGGVNFALAQGGRIGGRVTDSATGTGVEEVLVTIVDAQGRRVSDGYTDDNGDYITGAGLPTGTFFAVVEDVFDGLLPEIFENMPCSAADCLARATTGTPIAVTTGATTPGRNFALEHGGRISGRVTNAAGDGVEDGSVFIYDVHGRFVDSASPARGGTFLTDRGLPAGTYHAFTFDFGGLVNEIFDNRPCLYECEPSAVTSGAPISVSLGVTTPGVNFALAAAAAPGAPYALEAATDAGRVRITWQAPDSGAAAVSYLLDAGLAPGTTVITIPVAGTQYLIDSAPPGRYFLRVRAVNAAGAGPASSELEMTVGAANVIAPDAPQFPVMTMVGRRLIMTWDPPYSGGPVGQYLIEAGSASGLSNIGSLFVTGPLFTYEPVPDGVYFLRVRARNAAGTSAPSDEVMLVVGGGPSPPQAPGEPAAVVHGSTVTLSWFAPPGPVSGYILEAGSASGLSNLATAALGPATTVSFPGIPRGTYYVRMRAVNAQGSSIVSDEVTVVVP
jgi:hypothetical protein